jgi:hypothetical protein
MGAFNKTCPTCGGNGPFGSDKKAKDGLKYYCKKCCAEKQAAYRKANPNAWKSWAEANAEHLKSRDAARYAANPEKEIARVMRWQARNPDLVKQYTAKSRLVKYGITVEQKDAILTSQKGLCPICSVILTEGRVKTGACIDHDHSTGRVRGILCLLCNVMLGAFKEDLDLLTSTVTYLQKGLLQDLPVITDDKITTRSYNLWYNYGITEEVVETLLSNQGGKCSICPTPLLPSGRNTHVDHDHVLGKKAIRGILCRSCNLGVGHARDNPDILRAALSYLVKHS